MKKPEEGSFTGGLGRELPAKKGSKKLSPQEAENQRNQEAAAAAEVLRQVSRVDRNMEQPQGPGAEAWREQEGTAEDAQTEVQAQARLQEHLVWQGVERVRRVVREQEQRAVWEEVQPQERRGG